MRRIKYICYYNSLYREQNRLGKLSAVTKINYIISALNRAGYVVDIISKTPQACNEFKPSLGRFEVFDNGNTLRHFFSIGFRGYRLLYVLSRALNSFHFFIWLLINVRYKETIIVYHSTGYCFSLLLLRLIKRITIIGEIEEIYNDVRHDNILTRSFETRFIESCDRYIFPTSLLNDKLNKRNKPFVIVHGVYSSTERVYNHANDKIIHVVYGGTLDPEKGCIDAVRSVGFLPNNFHIHICGAGTKKEQANLLHIINIMHAEGYDNVSFEGNLNERDYNKFIQQSHIGLCTQNPKADFTNTSFPSKILMYLANGLQVVSIKIPSIFESSIAPAIIFYEEQSPQIIADAIIRCSQTEKFDTQSFLENLDEQFLKSIHHLLDTTL